MYKLFGRKYYSLPYYFESSIAKQKARTEKNYKIQQNSLTSFDTVDLNCAHMDSLLGNDVYSRMMFMLGL